VSTVAVNKRSTSPLGILFALGLGAALGGACDLGTDEGPCDAICPNGPFASVEENADENGVLTCTCDSPPSQAGCESYCEEVGGDVDAAAVVGDSCVCPPA